MSKIAFLLFVVFNSFNFGTDNFEKKKSCAWIDPNQLLEKASSAFDKILTNHNCSEILFLKNLEKLEGFYTPPIP